MYALFIIGRILFGGYFVYNAFNHFANITMLTGYAASKRVPMPKAAVIVSGVMLLLGGLSILLNMYAVIGLWLLIVFMIVTTVMMHPFWNEKDPTHRMQESVQFAKNIAILGALILLVA